MGYDMSVNGGLLASSSVEKPMRSWAGNLSCEWRVMLSRAVFSVEGFVCFNVIVSNSMRQVHNDQRRLQCIRISKCYWSLGDE